MPPLHIFPSSLNHSNDAIHRTWWMPLGTMNIDLPAGWWLRHPHESRGECLQCAECRAGGAELLTAASAINNHPCVHPGMMGRYGVGEQSSSKGGSWRGSSLAGAVNGTWSASHVLAQLHGTCFHFSEWAPCKTGGCCHCCPFCFHSIRQRQTEPPGSGRHSPAADTASTKLISAYPKPRCSSRIPVQTT